MTRQDLITAIADVSAEHWKSHTSPALLSGLPKRLESVHPDYRDVLGKLSLKRFINDTASAGNYQLVEHPTLKAKIGVMPADAQFEFSQAASTHPLKIITTEPATTHAATLNFLKALATLPDADQAQVVIPVAILAKLLN